MGYQPDYGNYHREVLVTSYLYFSLADLCRDIIIRLCGVQNRVTPLSTVDQLNIHSSILKVLVTVYAECQAFCPVVRIGTPTPSSASKHCSPPPTLWFWGGGRHTGLQGKGLGSQFGRRDSHSGTLCIL
jgi:hypothetical protein